MDCEHCPDRQACEFLAQFGVEVGPNGEIVRVIKKACWHPELKEVS